MANNRVFIVCPPCERHPEPAQTTLLSTTGCWGLRNPDTIDDWLFEHTYCQGGYDDNHFTFEYENG